MNLEEFFTKNKYSKWYLNIINYAKDRKRDPSIYEHHHILPNKVFPEYSNLKRNKWNGVHLTFREHLICHLLIWKYYKSIGDKKAEIQMAFAARNMSSVGRYNSRQYDIIKKATKQSIGDIQRVYVDKEWLRKELQVKTLQQVVRESGIAGDTLTYKARIWNIVIKHKSKHVVIDIDWLQEELKTKAPRTIMEENDLKYDLLWSRIKHNNLTVYVKRKPMKKVEKKT